MVLGLVQCGLCGGSVLEPILRGRQRLDFVQPKVSQRPRMKRATLSTPGKGESLLGSELSFHLNLGLKQEANHDHCRNPRLDESP